MRVLRPQVSEFGAFLDVAVDILSRGAVLAAAGTGPWAAVVLMVEATTFVCTHAVRVRILPPSNPLCGRRMHSLLQK